MTACKHCGGTGEEPDPLHDAARDLDQTLAILVTDQQARDVLRVKALAFSAAAARRIADGDARIVFLEAALRDILGRFPEPGALQGSHQFLQCSNENIADWRKILDAEQ